MKNKPDPDSGEGASGPGSAKRVRKTSLYRQSQEENVLYGTSVCKGPIKEAISAYDGATRPLTIFSSSLDRTPERNEVPGHRFRKIFFRDENEILNSDMPKLEKTIKLTVVVSHTDMDFIEPNLFVEQRTYVDGREMAVLLQLNFGSQIRENVEYLFKSCGDEDIGGGKRDLAVRFNAVDPSVTFNKYMRDAEYYGYDRDISVSIEKSAFQDGYFYKFGTENTRTDLYASGYGVFFDGSQLKSLFAGKTRGLSDRNNDPRQETELIRMKFPGFGHPTENGHNAGALNLRLSICTSK